MSLLTTALCGVTVVLQSSRRRTVQFIGLLQDA